MAWTTAYGGCSPSYSPTVTTNGIVMSDRPGAVGCAGSIYTTNTYNFNNYKTIEFAYYHPAANTNVANNYSERIHISNGDTVVKTILDVDWTVVVPLTSETVDISDVTGYHNINVQGINKSNVIYYIR